MLQPKTDRTQIEELMARYASAIDAKQYDEIASCFAADATAQYPGFSGLLKGTSDIVAHMRLALDALDATQHLFTNFIIDIEDDSARLSCEILAQHVRRGVRGGETYLAGGHYKVELRRIAGQWKIVNLLAQSRWGAGDRELLPGKA